MLPAHPRCRERGASLAEYGLLLTLFVVASIIAVSSLSSAARGKLEAVGEDVGTGSVQFAADSRDDVPSLPSASPTTAAPTTAPPTTAPPTTAAPTTAPPTTAAPTTAPPTTAPPTTAAPTTAPPATAPPVSSQIAGSASGARQWWDSWGQRGAWVATATITNSHNRPAWVYLEISTVYGDGRVVKTTSTVYVGPNGSTPFSTYDNAQSKNATTADDVVQVRVRPTGGITYANGWNETPLVVSGTSITADAPSMP